MNELTRTTARTVTLGAQGASLVLAAVAVGALVAPGLLPARSRPDKGAEQGLAPPPVVDANQERTFAGFSTIAASLEFQDRAAPPRVDPGEAPVNPPPPPGVGDSIAYLGSIRNGRDLLAMVSFGGSHRVVRAGESHDGVVIRAIDKEVLEIDDGRGIKRINRAKRSGALLSSLAPSAGGGEMNPMGESNMGQPNYAGAASGEMFTDEGSTIPTMSRPGATFTATPMPAVPAGNYSPKELDKVRRESAERMLKERAEEDGAVRPPEGGSAADGTTGDGTKGDADATGGNH